MKSSKTPHLTDPLKRYWYLCLLYVLFSYALTQILVLGSDRIADATDNLFAGEAIVLQEFMVPFIVLMLLGGAAAFGKTYSKNTFSIRMQTDMRNMLIGKLVKIRTVYFDKEGTGALMNKLLSDMYQIEALFAECIPELLVAFVSIVTVCVYIGIQSVRLLFVTLVCYPILLWIANRLTKAVGAVAAVRRQLYDDLENSAYDAIQGILVGKAFNLYELQKKRIDHIEDDIVKNESHRTKVLAANYVMGDLVRWIPKLICYLFCLYEAGKGRMSVGAIFAYVMLLDQIARPMGNIPGQIASIKEYAVSVRRLQEVLNQEEEMSGTGDFVPEGDTVIELSHVSFGYSEEKEVLKDISLTVKKGSSVAFVGRSGGGKSTVMKILCGFYYPQKGQYRIYGHDFGEWDIGSHSQTDGRPGCVCNSAPIGNPRQSHKQPSGHVRSLGAHGRDPWSQASSSQKISIRIGVCPFCKGYSQYNNHRHINDHRNQYLYCVSHFLPSLPFLSVQSLLCIDLIIIKK